MKEKDIMQLYYPALEETNESAKNVENIQISTETKRLIKYRAIFSDLCNNIYNTIDHKFGHDENLLKALNEADCAFDKELSKIIGMFVSEAALQSNFTNI